MSPSSFFDHSTTHTYSDWLMAAVLEIGADLTEELHFAAFPDLSPVLMREEGKCWIDKNEASIYFSEHLSELGQWLKKNSKNKTFIDLACGDPLVSLAPAEIAKGLGFKKYRGIDQRPLPTLQDQFIEYQSDDILLAVNKIPKSEAKLIFISGLELLQDQKDSGDPDNVMMAIKKVMKRGDILILGAATYDFEVPSGFKWIYEDLYHRVLVRRWF